MQAYVKAGDNTCVGSTGEDVGRWPMMEGAASREACESACEASADCSGYEW